jgi:hypothetical protein
VALVSLQLGFAVSSLTPRPVAGERLQVFNAVVTQELLGEVVDTKSPDSMPDSDTPRGGHDLFHLDALRIRDLAEYHEWHQANQMK